MDARIELTAVAFLQSVGGRIGVLWTIDRDDVALYDGAPALLVEHRPGAAAEELRMEGPDAMSERFLAALAVAAEELAALVDAAHRRDGTFDGGLLVGRAVVLSIPADVH